MQRVFSPAVACDFAADQLASETIRQVERNVGLSDLVKDTCAPCLDDRMFQHFVTDGRFSVMGLCM